LKVGVALNVLDEDVAREEVLFFHQLLQEFFAARKLAQAPDPELVRVAWRADSVNPSLAETIAGLADSDPLPPLPQTGWEETTVLAAALSTDADSFVHLLIAMNLPLAARCASAPDVKVSEVLKNELRYALIARTQDMTADLRARIAAGLALGDLGDPRFERRTGPFGDYLLPPLIPVESGSYFIGDDDSPNILEKPTHIVDLEAFQIGQFPVTNAEYALFIEAGGYEDKRWWYTNEILSWENGKLIFEGQIEMWRAYRKAFFDYSTQELVQISPYFSQTLDVLIQSHELDDRDFEIYLQKRFSERTHMTNPLFWSDVRFSNPSQPVVGVTWYEVRAYCRWLSAQTGYTIELPTEQQWESAARPSNSSNEIGNTRKSHILCTSPIGIYPPNYRNLFDIVGNVWDWTNTIFGVYPHIKHPNDGINDYTFLRIIRGGCWLHYDDASQATFRGNNYPYGQYDDVGFRICISY